MFSGLRNVKENLLFVSITSHTYFHIYRPAKTTKHTAYTTCVHIFVSMHHVCVPQIGTCHMCVHTHTPSSVCLHEPFRDCYNKTHLMHSPCFSQWHCTPPCRGNGVFLWVLFVVPGSCSLLRKSCVSMPHPQERVTAELGAPFPHLTPRLSIRAIIA